MGTDCISHCSKYSESWMINHETIWKKYCRPFASNMLWWMYGVRKIHYSMRKQLQHAAWLHGGLRQFFGPQVGTLVPLNLLAAAFTHSHSDTSMRMVHGYSSLGLLIGVYRSVALIFIQLNLGRKLLASFLLTVNIIFLYINTWIAVKGMGIPYGRMFHVLLAILLTVNFVATSQSHKKLWLATR